MSVDRNTGWLPEGFEIKDLDAPRRMAQRVQTCVVVHRKRVRVAQGVGALAALALILGVAPLLWRSAVVPAPQSQIAHVDAAHVDAAHSPAWTPETSPSEPPAATIARRGGPPWPPAAVQGLAPGQNDAGRAGAPSPTDHGGSGRSDISIQKVGTGVELAWHGNPSQEFVVYRCTSPKFDRCDVAGIVKGTKWVDSGKETAPVVFYRVEPKA